MASPQNKSGSMLPAIISVMVLAIIGVAAYFFLNPSQTEGLYVYYPKDTIFFVELEPGEELAKSGLAFYKNQEAKAQAVLKKSNTSLPKSSAKSSDGLMDTLLAKEFTTLFKPHFSLGSWAKKETSTATPGTEGHLLAVIPLLDPEMTVETFVPKLEKALGDFKTTEHQKVTILTSKTDSALSLAVYQKNLMVTSGEEAMVEALDHIANKEEHLYDLAAHKTGISKLPQGRIATIVANYSELPAQPDKKVQELQNMFPYLYGAGRLEQGKEMMLWDVYVPFFMDKVKNEEFQEALRGFFAADKNNFKAAGTLPDDTQLFLSLGRMDELINIGIEQFGKGNAEFQKNLAGAQFMLGMMKIDLKKDIIGFFHEEVVLAIRKSTGAQKSIEENQNIPMLLTSDNTNKASTLKKLITVASGGMLPVQHKNEQIGDVSVDTFVAPGQPQRISVAQLGSGMIAVTDPVEMDFLINVNKNQTPALKESKLFKEMTSSLPTTGMSMIFMDMNGADEQIEGFAGTLDSKDEKGFEAHITIKLKPGILSSK